ncbi:hypothetical protein [Streptomyces sp. NPDC059009]|uniref:5'-methylthioadenosine/S-adenosylhomocysteine nucleosidase family protein n=1 Tax=Streptomyces sp. NPDC059009 TaxID=3346694 RepID=UPI0036BD994D
MTESHSGDGPAAPGAATGETADEACRTLVHLLYGRRNVWDPLDSPPDGRGQLKRSLLIADYARKSLGLSEERKPALDRLVVDSFLPVNPSVRWQGVPPEADAATAADIGVVVVIHEELEAVLQVFGLDRDRFESAPGGQRFYSAEVTSAFRPGRPLSLVITPAGRAGNVHVVEPTRELVKRYDPQAVFLLGTAAGVRGAVRLGDVVASDRVHYHGMGRVTMSGSGDDTEQQPRPKYEHGNDPYGYGLYYFDSRRQRFRDQVTDFLARLPADVFPDRVTASHQPQVHTGNVTITSGENVLRDGKFLAALRERHDETIRAADMEAYGFVRAVGARRWLIFRGISDYGDARQREKWKFLSSAFAALSLQEFLRTCYLPPGVDSF